MFITEVIYFEILLYSALCCNRLLIYGSRECSGYDVVSVTLTTCYNSLLAIFIYTADSFLVLALVIQIAMLCNYHYTQCPLWLD